MNAYCHITNRSPRIYNQALVGSIYFGYKEKEDE